MKIIIIIYILSDKLQISQVNYIQCLIQIKQFAQKSQLKQSYNLLYFFYNTFQIRKDKMKKVGEYELIRLIGKGSYGNVFQARKQSSNQKLAIKMIPNEHINTNHMQTIQKQIEILKKIEHPNIVKLLDTRKTKNNYYLIFQFCQNGDLEKYIKKHYDSQMPEELIQKIVFQLADALLLIHSKNIVHRDIKLANILVTKQFVVKLADFGFAKSNQNSEILMETYCGTPITMAPEILERRQYDFKCDIWSMGIIIYQLVYGKPPFLPNPGRGLMDLLQMIQSSQSIFFPQSPKMKQSFKQLIINSLKKNPKQRYSIQQFYNNQWIQQGRSQSKNKEESTSSSLLKSVCKQFPKQQQSGIFQTKINIQQLEKAIARRIYYCLQQQLIKIERQIISTIKNIDGYMQNNFELNKLKKFLIYYYVKNLKNSIINVIYRKQQFDFKIKEIGNLNEILEDYEQCQYVSFKQTIFNYLDNISNSEKTNSKQKSIFNYKLALEFMNLIKRFTFRIIVTSSNHESSTRLKQIKKNLLYLKFSQQNTNNITINLDYIIKKDQYYNQIQSLRNLCEKRIRDIQQFINGY